MNPFSCTCPTVMTRGLGVIAGVFVLLTGGCGRSDAAARQEPTDSAAARRPSTVAELPRQLDGLPARPGVGVASVTVRRDTSTFSLGPAVATLESGDTVVVGDSAFRAWRFRGSPLVAVSGIDGAGGYENEGQSLTVIDLATGSRRRVVADYFAIVRVDALSADGRAALLVHMQDGGQGSTHVTVVDPKRGQVFRVRNALGRIVGDRILVSSYGDSETPVQVGDRRTPLRVDTLTLATIDTMSLLVIPRSVP